MTIELDLEGRVRWADEAARRLLGGDDCDPVGIDWFEHCAEPGDVDIYREHLHGLKQRPAAPIVFEARCRGPHGDQYRIRWHAVILPSDDEQTVRLTGALMAGVTNGDAIGEALEQLLDLRFAMDQASIVAATDRRGVITYVNDTFCRISGYSRDELLGRTHKIINSGYHPPGFFKKMWATIGRGAVWQGDVCNRGKNGELYWVATTIVPFLDARGKPYRYLAIRNDITARRRAEEALSRTVEQLEAANHRILEEQSRLLQAEKLSSVGLLAAGVAHEINNPLAGTMACVKQLRDGKVAEHRRGMYFETVLDGLDRIQNIVSALLSYARPTSSNSSDIEITSVLDGCLPLLRPVIHKARVRIDKAAPEPSPRVHGDRQQLMQAAMNVLINAVHASPPGGVITVDYPELDGRIGIRITDQGPGIPDVDVDRVCDPFFSTKPEGTGTGLGLSVTLGIVQAHQGELRIGRAEPHGAVVTLWLPAAG